MGHGRLPQPRCPSNPFATHSLHRTVRSQAETAIQTPLSAYNPARALVEMLKLTLAGLLEAGIQTAVRPPLLLSD